MNGFLSRWTLWFRLFLPVLLLTERRFVEENGNWTEEEQMNSLSRRIVIAEITEAQRNEIVRIRQWFPLGTMIGAVETSYCVGLASPFRVALNASPRTTTVAVLSASCALFTILPPRRCTQTPMFMFMLAVEEWLPARWEWVEKHEPPSWFDSGSGSTRPLLARVSKAAIADCYCCVRSAEGLHIGLCTTAKHISLETIFWRNTEWKGKDISMSHQKKLRCVDESYLLTLKLVLSTQKSLNHYQGFY